MHTTLNAYRAAAGFARPREHSVDF